MSAALLATLTIATGGAETAPAAASSAQVTGYDLGDRAFTVPGLRSGKNHDGPMELTGRVYLPADVGHGRHPLVVIVHGYWTTCADARAQAVYDDPASTEAEWVRAADLLNRWPCAAGTPTLPSYRGYDYLGRALAAHGIVAVSIGANGANAIDSWRFQGDEARAALVAEHLRLWQQFATTGHGPLAGRLPRDLVGHVDLRNVGLTGHSRAGRAVQLFASDARRSTWPRGVTIRGVLGLATAGDDPGVDYTTTTMPLGLLYGTCDDNIPTSGYYPPSAKASPESVYKWQLRGANHDFWNVQWSPSSGQVGAYDDAANDNPDAPGRCRQTSGKEDRYVPQLTEAEQRRYGSTYVSAFFAKALSGDRRFDALLDGRAPLKGVRTTTNGR